MSGGGGRGIPCNADPAGLLRQVRLFALDMDGTLYLGEEWIAGAMAFLRRIEERGGRWVCLTNNSSKSAGVYRDKLARMGLETRPGAVLSSAHATMAYLRREWPGRRVYLMGNPALRAEFEAAGIALSEADPELVVTAYDTTVDYAKFCRVCDLVRAGLPYIGTHPDLNCPTETGFVPDIGSFHALIAASTGRQPDVIIGKPHAEMARHLLAETGCQAAEVCMVGDRLYTDIAFGRNNGFTSVLVLSGETGMADLERSSVQPDLVFDSVEQMMEFL